MPADTAPRDPLAAWRPSPHQARIPGPPRLPMAGVDISGRPNADPGFIADRLAILNHFAAYAYLIDEGRWEEWYALFADDMVFESTAPGFGTIRARGKAAFRAFADSRYRGPGHEANTAMRRHTQGNQHIAYQDERRAELRTYMLISLAQADGSYRVLTSGTYNVTLEKRGGAWTITRFYVEVDAPVAPSPIPEGVEFIPDPRNAAAGDG